MFKDNHAFYGQNVSSYPVALSINESNSNLILINKSKKNSTATLIIHARTGVPLVNHHFVFMYDIQGQ